MGLDAIGVRTDDHQLPWNTESGCCVVVGSGRCVWDDLSSIMQRQNNNIVLPGDVIAINDVGMHVPFKVKHWYSNDHRWLPHWANSRRPTHRKYLDENEPITLHTCQNGSSGMRIWPFPGHGSSGLNATYLACALGYERILVAGVPLDDSGHYFDPPWEQTNFLHEVPERPGGPRYWEQARRLVWENRVQVLSGRMSL